MLPRRLFLLSSGVLVMAQSACTTTAPVDTPADRDARRRKIDRDAEDALARLYAQVHGARELASKARGILVFPRVVSAGFMVGASYGEGKLIASHPPVTYYRVASASVGLLAGAQSRALYLFFMTEDSLDRFTSSSGWTAGGDASVAAATVGANGELDMRTTQAPIVGFVLTNLGLMANLSLSGTRFIRSDL